MPTSRSSNGSTGRFPTARRSPARPTCPRLLATIYITPGTLRLTSPRVETLEQAEEKLGRMLGAAARPLERVAAPLPLPFLDADVWTTRLPEGLDRDLSHRLARETVETYYENQWIHRPRQGLDGLSPLAAAQDARRGDSLAQAKLEAVIRVREQLGSRSSASRSCTRAIPSTDSGTGWASHPSIPTRSTPSTSRAPRSRNSRSSIPKTSTTPGFPRRSSRPPVSATMP